MAEEGRGGKERWGRTKKGGKDGEERRRRGNKNKGERVGRARVETEEVS